MKAFAFALALLGATAAEAAVTYDFTSYLPVSPGGTVLSFSLTVDDFLSAEHTEIAPEQLSACSAANGECGRQIFDRQAPTGGPFGIGHDYLITEAGTFGVFHFFDYGAFTTLGTHYAGNPDIGTTGQLVVSQSVAPVPEPGEWAMMAAGLGVVGAVARRRKAGRK